MKLLENFVTVEEGFSAKNWGKLVVHSVRTSTDKLQMGERFDSLSELYILFSFKESKRNIL